MLKLTPLRSLGLAAALIPVAYLLGRFAITIFSGTPWLALAASLTTLALGALLGIPLGLAFGQLSPQKPALQPPHHPHTIEQQDKILAQLRAELSQNQQLFQARKGNAEVLTRINYLTDFWEAVKASGQLFVMQEPKLLNTIATAYYWLKQANRLESLAYESQYKPSTSPDNQNASTHLIAEARLLDGPLGVALSAAIDGINAQITTDTPAFGQNPIRN
jgi:hypothetical protein